MALTLASAADLLKEHHLLREIIQGDVWTDDPARIASADEPFAGITYDTRKVTPGTLLCCKGQFKAEYLNGIDEAGLAAYVAETEYSAATATPGLIVNDARKAMSLLSAAFYGYPQNELTVIGVTAPRARRPPRTSRRRLSTPSPAARPHCSPRSIIALTATPTSNPI